MFLSIVDPKMKNLRKMASWDVGVCELLAPGFLKSEILLKTPATAQARWFRAVVAPKTKTL
jgi:hypothetical protein